ncbi:hypothetical protein K435DRAFT_798222 [Dendrothele bispora CBS 962.96]|uniref:Uncharacterized protein n=1 Tax=Dendrothele bispora (strain CBS 962.96) TaxID=1314807 RepID=A0A4S8M129_DENBC|nr:hypothetical protein K435DRAFT_798222 [Dendrothele bispora CBS 962.96]
MSWARNPTPRYAYRTRRAEQDTGYNATGTRTYENSNPPRYTTSADAYPRNGRNDFGPNDNRADFTTVPSLTNNYQRNTSAPNTIVPVGVHSLESDNPTTDTPFINAWTSDGDQVTIDREVVDTVGIGITRAVVCASLLNGRTTITVLARPPLHPTRSARSDELSPSGLILQILASSSVAFGIIYGLHTYELPLPRPLQYLINGAPSPTLGLVANSTGLNYFYSVEDAAFFFVFLLGITISASLITRKTLSYLL